MNTGFLDLSYFQSDIKPRIVRVILEEARRRGIQIHIVTLTGGPLAGKSTGLIRIAYEFRCRGWFVVSVPEAATIVRGAGFTAETGVISLYASQQAMIRVGEMLFIQMLIDAVNAGHPKIVVVRDRSSFDCAAYMPNYDEFSNLVHELGINMSDMATSDRTIFLDSLGVDNPELYNRLCTNNSVRHENAAQAAAANTRLLDAYEYFGIPLIRIGNNHPDGVDGKNAAVINELLSMVHEAPVQSQVAYAVAVHADTLVKSLGFNVDRRMRITQFYLDGWRYREVAGPDNARTYVKTKKVRTDNAVVRYREDQYINSGEFSSLMHNVRDVGGVVVIKNRFFGFRDVGKNRCLITVDDYSPGPVPVAGDYCRVEVSVSDALSGLPSFLTGLHCVDVTGGIQHSDEGFALGTYSNPFNPS